MSIIVSHSKTGIKRLWDFTGSPMGKTPMQGAQVQPLIEELRSYMLCGPAKKEKDRERDWMQSITTF